ncbi:DUF4369 domain-containing protein [Pedobacter sp. HDW13]|uniref:DUF4369 domain-containing protein n=1 Tax=unclassified Pedobacter TaxID=2628915 RepID=UPI000F59EE01|nr:MULTISPECIES: DUF4369 domain-containing protein [unclassified Pedobacter]QIL39980.1 DUF4369 domain-containing protein [Pedobacter sp. HDW13]RQO64255.1 hypothetical protein DBR40_26085 [Pedobacter sp. KBW01]
MKRYLVILAIFFASSAIAQNINFTIKGEISNTDSIKYAYLTTLSQQIPISSDKIFMVMPVINGKFEFKGAFDLEGKDYQYASVFFEERGNISKEEALSKFRNLIWLTGARRNAKLIVLEDLTLSIDNYGNTKAAKITDKGILTRQSDEVTEAIKARDRKMIAFVKKYADSPVAFYQVEQITSMFDVSRKDRMQSMYGLPLELFNELSPRLKNSKKGLELKKNIDDKVK